MDLNKIWYTVFFSLSITSLIAQQNRYFIFYSDKDNTPYSIERPSEYLSERSIQRRERQLLRITEEDLPVDPAYVQEVRDLGIDVFYNSKWLNGSVVQTDPSNIESVLALNFVDSVAFLAPGERLLNISSDKRKSKRGKKKKRTSSESNVEKFQGSLPQLNMLDVPLMHSQGYSGQGMLVAVFDGGFRNLETDEELDHLLQNDQVLDHFNFVLNDEFVYDYSEHGTQVLSCMASASPSLLGVVPDAEYLLYVTEDVRPEHRVEEMNWLLAAERADSIGVDVINSSVGYVDFDDPSMTYSFEDFDGQSILVTIAAEKAFAKGIITVCSAGNERGFGGWDGITGPADGENVIAVGAITQDTLLANFSSMGPTFDGRIKPDVIAMGVRTIVSRGAGITTNNGTSFASPLVAGLVAGYWQSERELSAFEVVESIRNSGHIFNTNQVNDLYGFGIPSFSRLNNGAIPVNDVITSIGEGFETEVKIYPNPLDNTELYISPGSYFSNSELRVSIFDLNGQIQLDLIERLQISDPIIIDTIDLTQGTYVLNIADGEREFSTRIIKK
ncbi:MAG: S8 family peptidase [Bacteroidota bacterium]